MSSSPPQDEAPGRPTAESTPLLPPRPREKRYPSMPVLSSLSSFFRKEPEPDKPASDWPRGRKMGSLYSKSGSYPPPRLPRHLRRVQSTLDESWNDWEEQVVWANWCSIISMSLTLFIAISSLFSSVIASLKPTWATTAPILIGPVTTVVTLILGIVQKSGQPGRAEALAVSHVAIVRAVEDLFNVYGDAEPPPGPMRDAMNVEIRRIMSMRAATQAQEMASAQEDAGEANRGSGSRGKGRESPAAINSMTGAGPMSDLEQGIVSPIR